MCQACQKGQTAGHAVKTLTLKGRPYQRLWKYGFRCAGCYLPQTLKPKAAKPRPYNLPNDKGACWAVTFCTVPGPARSVCNTGICRWSKYTCTSPGLHPFYTVAGIPAIKDTLSQPVLHTTKTNMPSHTLTSMGKDWQKC